MLVEAGNGTTWAGGGALATKCTAVLSALAKIHLRSFVGTKMKKALGAGDGTVTARGANLGKAIFGHRPWWTQGRWRGDFPAQEAAAGNPFSCLGWCYCLWLVAIWAGGRGKIGDVLESAGAFDSVVIFFQDRDCRVHFLWGKDVKGFTAPVQGQAVHGFKEVG